MFFKPHPRIYFTFAKMVSVMMRGNWRAQGRSPQPSAGCCKASSLNIRCATRNNVTYTWEVLLVRVQYHLWIRNLLVYTFEKEQVATCLYACCRTLVQSHFAIKVSINFARSRWFYPWNTDCDFLYVYNIVIFWISAFFSIKRSISFNLFKFHVWMALGIVI